MSFQALEICAVILAIAYLLLAARENIFCWFWAFFSSGIYVYLFWQVGLLMESMLNIFYVLMACAGWLHWRSGGGQHVGEVPEAGQNKAVGANSLAIRTCKPWQHLLIISTMLVLALLNGWFMQTYTSAVWPFVDSFTTWASVITTFMVIYKYLENWLYWFVIDGISVYLYVDRALYLTALLFLAYLVIVAGGYISWRKSFLLSKAQNTAKEYSLL